MLTTNGMMAKENNLRLKAAVSFWIAGFLMSAVAMPAPRQAGKSSSVTKHSPRSYVDGSFQSKSLDREMHYRVLLPRGYQGSTKRFAVLYLLHGLYGNYTDWTMQSKLEDYAKPFPLIVVMPDAGDSWYTNSATVPGDKFEDYLVKDLIPEIDARFRTEPSRSARAIAGLSMGGYGALKFALKYPRLFAFAGSLSGGFDAALNLDIRVPEYREKLLAVFGPDGDATRPANDVFQLLNQAEAAQLPYLYIACGTEDGFLSINRDFVSGLPDKKIAFEYHETPGGHSWDYWDRSVQDLLRSLAKTLHLP
jgi:putative tributyrin esterase